MARTLRREVARLEYLDRATWLLFIVGETLAASDRQIVRYGHQPYGHGADIFHDVPRAATRILGMRSASCIFCTHKVKLPAQFFFS